MNCHQEDKHCIGMKCSGKIKLHKFSNYKKVIWKDPDDLRLGLLRYNTPPKNTIFIFVFPESHNARFHTIGMKFNIDIYFFDRHKELIEVFKNCEPGCKNISTNRPSKYVIEIPSK